MDIIIYNEFIKLINEHCNWAVIEDKLYINNSDNKYSTKHLPRALFVKFRTESQIANEQNMLPISEWNLDKAFAMMETDIKFKHRVKMHACTPIDADHWLQIAVFGNIMLK